ncbi:MAG: iron ABC transporter permease [Candidatus Omnitrophota bacterium]
MQRRSKRIIFISFLILCAVTLAGLLKGTVNIPAGELFSNSNLPIFYLRLSRVLTAIIVGCGLAASGIVLQAILRNSLAEPYLLGTSSGAGLGAVIAVMLGLSRMYLPLFGFLGAMASITLVYNLARQQNRISEQSLILSGVIVSVGLSAIIVFLISISGNEALHGFTWWLWGSFQVYDIKLLLTVFVLVFLGLICIYFFAQDLNAIIIGEEEAMHLGVDVEKVKKILILTTALITAAIVCICGIIGFVGLIVPHMARQIVGPNHKRLIPATCVLAGIFMVVCDTLSRTLFPPLEIPLGVITAIVGAPAFIFLFKKSQRVK